MIVSKETYEKNPHLYKCVEIKEGKRKGKMMYVSKSKEEMECGDKEPKKKKSKASKCHV